MPPSIEEFTEIVRKEKIFDKYRLDYIGVFGSFARGEKAHDIDSCIEPADDSYDYLNNIKYELKKLTGKKIDIMYLKNADPIIYFYAKKDMIYVTK